MNLRSLTTLPVILFLALGLGLGACAKKSSTDAPTDTSSGGGGGGGGGTPKAVLSSWTAITGITLGLDWTAGNLNGVPFNGYLTYGTALCTYTLELGPANTPGNCTVMSAPSFSGTAVSGMTSADCTTNTYNICGTGGASGTGQYNWDGTGLSFTGNALQFR